MPRQTPQRPRTTGNPRGAGAPTKQTAERARRIVEVLCGGGTRRAACATAGISEDTFARWLERSADFADAIEKAEAAAELRCTKIVFDAASDSWQAAAWWLERRRSQDYSRRERLDIDVRARAEQLAQEVGIDAHEIIREAERLLMKGRAADHQ